MPLAHRREALAPLGDQLGLGIAGWFVVLGLPRRELSIALHRPGPAVVAEIEIEQAFEFLAKWVIFNWRDGFNATIEIAGHPVGAADKDFGGSAILKPENS